MTRVEPKAENATTQALFFLLGHAATPAFTPNPE